MSAVYNALSRFCDRADLSASPNTGLSLIPSAASRHCSAAAPSHPRAITSECGTLTDHRLLAPVVVRLECPVCFYIMLPPIFQCDRGHCVCAICHPLLTFCPLCRGVLGEARCLALENLSGDALSPCRFEHLGCRVRVSVDDWLIHTRACGFAPGAVANRDLPIPSDFLFPIPRFSPARPSSPRSPFSPVRSLSPHSPAYSPASSPVDFSLAPPHSPISVHSSPSSAGSAARSRYSTSLDSSHEI